SNHATLTAANGFTNSGEIRMIATGTQNESRLNVLSGTLVNGSTGAINVNPGQAGGGFRQISATMNNLGAVNINTSATFSGATTNQKNFTTASGVTLNFPGGQIFTQSGGTLTAPGSTFSMTSGTFNFNGGAINGSPTLLNSTLNNNTAAGSGTLLIHGTSSVLTGNIPNGEIVAIEATPSNHATLTSANGFTNAGEIQLTSTAGNEVTLILTSGT